MFFRALGAAALLLPSLLPTPLLRAGDYHDGATLSCIECHVMHAGPPVATPGSNAARTSSGVGRLLRQDVNDLCLSCHDGGRATDVLGRNEGRRAGALRQAGHLNRLGTVGQHATGHTLDSLTTAPGSSPPWRPEQENGPGNGLNCINCHGHHGSRGAASAYRNLRDDAGNNEPGDGLVTYNALPGTNDLGRDVFVRRSLRYDESDVDFNEPDPNDSAMGRYCAGCHDLFHGGPKDPSIGGKPVGSALGRFLRHPTAGVNLGQGVLAGSNFVRFASLGNRVKVMSEAGLWDPPGRNVSLTCISCHRAHGNDNPFGLIYRSGRGTPTENGDTGGRTVEDLCGQCHGASPLP